MAIEPGAQVVFVTDSPDVGTYALSGRQGVVVECRLQRHGRESSIVYRLRFEGDGLPQVCEVWAYEEELTPVGETTA